jgi:hypothetical protein
MTEQRDSSPKPRGPLVLLHVTLLPCPALGYSVKSIAELAPSYFLENWRLLQEKVGDTILARGVLIPHPGEEYDLLEERVLESLDLWTPRILDCGHFYAPDEDAEDDSGTDSGVSDVGRKSSQPPTSDATPRKDEEQVLEGDFCTCCSRPVHGVITGRSRRWNLRIYAANGLMRAGAWAASYSEMERIDVEIEPWLPEDVKRDLDNRREQEDQEEQMLAAEADRLRSEIEEMEKKRQDEEVAKKEAIERVKQMELEVKTLNTALLSASQAPASQPVLSKDSEGLKETAPTIPPVPQVRTKGVAPSIGKDIPLSKLLFNYLYLLAQDRRNIALAILSLLVVFLAIGSRSVKQQSVSPVMHSAETSQLAALSQLSSQPSTNVDSGTSIILAVASSPPLSVGSGELPPGSSASDSSHPKPSLPVSSRLDTGEPSMIAKSSLALSESAVGNLE